MTKEWRLRKQLSDDLEKHLLLNRGITKKADIEEFFTPDYEKDLHDPFLMKDMDKAVKRILEAIKNQERIILYGDYDADGVCGVAVFHDFFKKIGFDNFDVYIPDKYKEGYGLSLGVIDEFNKDNVALIITVDCGIGDFDEIEKANKFGIGTIVTDHHLEQEKLPKALAIIDPNRKEDKYPFKSLCGAAVAFKTVEAILKKDSFDIVEGWHKWLLDVVAIATIADMMPLVKENRVLTFYGLKVLKKTSRVGLVSLFDALRLRKAEINEDDVGFLIAPRVNATGRMDHAMTGFSLLTTLNIEEAGWLVKRMGEKNLAQKEAVGQIIDGIEEILKQRKKVPEILVIGDRQWNASLLGIVATRICEKYNKPIFVWGKADNPEVKGSARRPNGSSLNLVTLLDQLGKEFFIDYGGHVFSAGFTLKEEKTPFFKKAIESAFLKTKNEKIEDILWIDREIEIEEIDWNLINLLEKFRPFGKDNEKALFLLRDLEVNNVKSFGNGGIHLQLDFRKANGEVIPAIGFFMNNNASDLDIERGDKIDLAASIERSTFKGYDELRLRIVDFKKHDQ